MTQDELKRSAALAAIDYVADNSIVGVGTGSTADHFIEALATRKERVRGAVASSERTATRLRAAGIALVDLNEIDELPLYIDGADEITHELAMIKGGGGALTREKIVAAVARRFVCVADATKLVAQLGRFPLPVEVIPMARAHVIRTLEVLGGEPRLRTGFVTDNGNVIVDVHGLSIADPLELERRINDIVGVVTNGLFALRPADVLLLGTPQGVQRFPTGTPDLKKR